VTINPADPRPDRLEEAAETLRRGELVALPTETFYGVAADAFCVDALRRINTLKQKAADSPILLLLADVEQARLVSDSLDPLFETLAEMFWPGPLTLVVPALPGVPAEVSGARGTVAVRMPGLALPRRLARALGRPITGVSANLHRRPASRTAAEVARELGEGLAMILDGGPTPGGASSTILDLTCAPPKVLRHGLLPANSLRPFLPELQDAPL